MPLACPRAQPQFAVSSRPVKTRGPPGCSMSTSSSRRTKKQTGGLSFGDVVKTARKAAAGALRSDPVQKGLQDAIQKAIRVVEGSGRRKGAGASITGGTTFGAHVPRARARQSRGGAAVIRRVK